MSGADAIPSIMAPALWLVDLISEWLTALGDTMIVLTPLALLFLALEGYYGRGFRFQWLWSIIAAVFLVKSSGLAVDYLIATSAHHTPDAPYMRGAPRGAGFRHVVYDPAAAQPIQWDGY